MITSENGYQLIRDEEGFSPIAKGDYGHQEIGFGHDLLPGEAFADGIDRGQGEFLLEHDVAKAEDALNPLVPATCTQNQFDALIDFTYECGGSAVKQLLAHGWDQVTMQLPRWIHAGGQVLEGMVTRRQKEIALFNEVSQ
jgi:GH24 family phage-related lysozyme (muramidase)